jgi:hypothetical protein
VTDDGGPWPKPKTKADADTAGFDVDPMDDGGPQPTPKAASAADAADAMDDGGLPCRLMNTAGCNPPDVAADLKPLSDNSWEDHEASTRSKCALFDAPLDLDLI